MPVSNVQNNSKQQTYPMTDAKRFECDAHDAKNTIFSVLVQVPLAPRTGVLQRRNVAVSLLE